MSLPFRRPVGGGRSEVGADHVSRRGLTPRAERAVLALPALALLLAVAPWREAQLAPVAVAQAAVVQGSEAHLQPPTANRVLRVCADPNNLPFSDS